MSYRIAIFLVCGAVLSLTLTVAAFEFFHASPVAAVYDEPKNYALMLIQFVLLYCAVVCIGGAMDCFLAGRSGENLENAQWPKDVSDDEVGDSPDSRAAHKS